MAIEVRAKEILRLRMASQRVAPRSGKEADAASICRRLLAIQAQHFGQALWAIGSRIAASSRCDVLDSLARGEIVRSLPMRGTLFFVAAEDLGWMLQLTAPRTIAGLATRHRLLGLDASTLARAAEVAVEALSGGRACSRAEFFAVLNAAGIPTDSQRGYNLILYLAQLRLICWGPPSGTQQALVLVDEWITSPRQLDHEESLREFVLRYFSGHGPATLADFCWWSKVTVADAKIGIALARDELTELVCDGTKYFTATSEVDRAPSRVPRVHLLPGFDEFILGYQNRSLSLAAEYASKIVPGDNGIFRPTIVSSGRVIGIWALSDSRVPDVETVLFEPMSERETAELHRQVRRYLAFTVAGERQ